MFREEVMSVTDVWEELARLGHELNKAQDWRNGKRQALLQSHPSPHSLSQAAFKWDEKPFRVT